MQAPKRSSRIILILMAITLTVSLGCTSLGQLQEELNAEEESTVVVSQVEEDEEEDQIYSNSPRTPKSYYLWNIKHFYGLKREAITQEDCEKWMTLWKGEKLFWAVNIPDGSDVFIDSKNQAQMKLLTSAISNPQTISQIALQKTTAHQAWMAQNLPQTAGAHWVALTGDGATASACPSGTTAAGQWKAQIDYLLDSGGGKEDGLNDQTREYYCYQGQDAPFFFPENQAARALFKLRAAQDDGITCMGPTDITVIEDYGDWYVAHPSLLYHSEPSPIQIRYHIYKPPTTYTIHWNVDSNVGTGWKLVFGNETGPYEPEQVVSNPFPATLTEFYVWALADMPASTADGSYATTVTFAVTNPENVQHATYDLRSLMWVGDWTPPAGSETKIYMPMLLR